MRIAICDDEEEELARLSALLAEYRSSCDANIVCHTFHSGIDLLVYAKGGEYDLILLDILMPGQGGLQTARELRAVDKNVKLILLTSSPEYAVESYSVAAYHYLLKPACAKTLFPLLNQIKHDLRTQEERGLVLKSRGGIVQISFSKLEYLEVMNKIVSFHMADGVVHESTSTLSDFEEKLLDRPEFLKIHRSYLVNLSHVQAISAKGAIMRTGHTIPISRMHYNQIKDAYMRYLFQAETKSPAKEMRPLKSAPQPHTAAPRQFLLIDDDPEDRAHWAGILQSYGCTVQTAAGGDAAKKLVAQTQWSCILLDVLLADENGFSLCRELQIQTDAPIIFLSNLTEADIQARGFAAGGADYITKDTPAALFWAKVKARVCMAEEGFCGAATAL